MVYANEFDKYARQTYQLNFPDTYLEGRDIHAVQPGDILARYFEIIMKVSTLLQIPATKFSYICTWFFYPPLSSLSDLILSFKP